MRGATALLLGCLVGSCTATHSADDFTACDQQCEDTLDSWRTPPVCPGDVIDRVKRCQDGLCLFGIFQEVNDGVLVLPDGCQQCIFAQLVACSRDYGCRCEWEAYNCCAEAHPTECRTGECGPCGVEALALLSCGGPIVPECQDLLEVCAVR